MHHRTTADPALRPTLITPGPAQAPAKPRKFCPIGGIAGDGTSRTPTDTHGLLYVRLRMGLSFMALGSGLFLLRTLVSPEPDLRATQSADLVLFLHAATAIYLAVAAGALWFNVCLSLTQLRWLELASFGALGGLFLFFQYLNGCFCAMDLNSMVVRAFIAETVLPWIVLIHCYGLFIPNTWGRAMAVVSVMTLSPLIVATIVAVQHPDVAQQIVATGGYSLMALWLFLAAAGAVWGSHRIGTLNREVAAAKQIGVYNLKQKLGAGGMGEVYLAEHQLLKRPSAIKLIRPGQAADPQAIARFESEVRNTAQLSHPNTIEVYDYGHADDGTFYYVMEYLPGLSLQELVDRYGPLPPERVIYLLRQICGALAEAHAQGLVHRDIKPGNIFAAQRGGIYDFAKLLDFGLVKMMVPEPDAIQLTFEGAIVGSPLYGAPELVLGDSSPDPRSDIYSLGATAYFLLTARPVFTGDKPLKVMFAHANEAPRAPSRIQPGIPADLEAVVMRCLEKAPGDRFQDVQRLEQALAHCEAADGWTKEQARRWWLETHEATETQYSSLAVEETATQIIGAPA